MNEHRSLKITTSKHDGYMGEMHTDLVAALRVLRVVSGYLDCSAVTVQPEMVRRFLLGEPHHVVATLINCGVMIILGYQPERPKEQPYKQCCIHFDSSSLEGGRINVSSR